jgi:predicted phage terminase large subunit-like protein
VTTQPIHESDYAHLVSPLALATQLTRGSAEPFQPTRHHRALNEALVRLHQRRDGEPRRLMVMMQPRAGKSLMASQWNSVWNIALDDTTKIILCSYGLNLAARFGRYARQTIESHYPVLGAEVLEDSRAAHRWGTKAGGGMECRGIGGGISGFGFDLGIIDDPVKDAAEAQSSIIREGIWDWYHQAFLTRRSPKAIIVLIMTRWHEDDLCGRLLKTEPELWSVLRIPAIAEDSNDALGREPGERLWPERFSQAHYDEIRTKSPRVFNALYQQRPSGQEGSGIERSWWRYYTEVQDHSSFERIIQIWDPTFKNVDSSDFVAGGAIGIRGEDMYLIDAEHARLNAPQTMRAIKAMRARVPSARRILIEDAANGPAIIQMLEHELTGITPVKAVGSKEARLHWGVNSVAAYIEAGHFYLPRRTREDEAAAEKPIDPRLCGIAERLVNEAAEFPYGEHDDLVDMVTHGTTYLMPATWSARRRADEATRALGELGDFVQQHSARLHRAVKDRLERETKERIEADRQARQRGLACSTLLLPE